MTAAILLLAIGAWAEMALAPMLLMHAAHMRPGHEMAADMATHASHHHASAEMASRPCCPEHGGPEHHGIKSAIEVSWLISDAPACDDPHNCCFRQGPQSVPAPASDLQQLARDTAPASRLFLDPPDSNTKDVVDEAALALRAPPDVFGVILRV